MLCNPGGLFCCLSQDAPKSRSSKSSSCYWWVQCQRCHLAARGPLLVLLRASQPYVHSCTCCFNSLYATWQAFHGTLYHLEMTPTSFNTVCHGGMFCPSEHFTKTFSWDEQCLSRKRWIFRLLQQTVNSLPPSEANNTCWSFCPHIFSQWFFFPLYTFGIAVSIGNHRSKKVFQKRARGLLTMGLY